MTNAKVDGLVKSPKNLFFVIPAEAGIQCFQTLLDPGFCRGDGSNDFLRSHQIWVFSFGIPLLSFFSGP
jgi:hypothetical protein